MSWFYAVVEEIKHPTIHAMICDSNIKPDKTLLQPVLLCVFAWIKHFIP